MYSPVSPAPVFPAADAIAESIAEKGWYAGNGLILPPLLEALRAEIDQLDAEAELTPAGVGRAEDHTLIRSIRRDRTRWLERGTLAQTLFLDEMEKLRQALNRRLFLGLFHYEAHYALYEPGGFYKRHLDSFRGAKNRLLSTVLYLNEGWREADGGLLHLYAAEDSAEPMHTILPRMGTFTVFLSEEMPHEVTLAHRRRASIAGWFRCNETIEAPVLQNTGLVEQLG